MFSINERMSSFVDDYSWESKVKVRREARNNELYEDRQCVGHHTLSFFSFFYAFPFILFFFFFPPPPHNVIDKTSADFLSAHSLVTHYRARGAGDFARIPG